MSFPAQLELSSLDGTNGFAINGIGAVDLSGRSTASAGDVNDDGFDDLIIGADSANPRGASNAGETYVLFGREAFPESFELSILDGLNGFIIRGIDPGDQSGIAVSSAGDLNADGFDDVVIGAVFADPNGQGAAGESYVVLGSAQPSRLLDLASLQGSDGFVLNGIGAGDRSGRAVASAGDVNGDGIDDLLIGAYGGDATGRNDAGESYVVLGSQSGFGASFDLAALNGTNGFVLDGADANDQSGRSIASAGDVNGDGIDDLVIGALFADPERRNDAGETYIIFGSDEGFAAREDLSLLDGTKGFVLIGGAARDYSGRAVASAGDLNGDGIDDIVIGASGADPQGRVDAGEVYVIFGGANLGSSGRIDLASINGAVGFTIEGINPDDALGYSVGSAGDINGDGIDDLILGSPFADPNGRSLAGESYVVFGSDQGFPQSLNLADLDGSTGFAINGVDAGDQIGRSVNAAGDVNRDGIGDLVIGALNGDPGGRDRAGETYVVFGQRTAPPELDFTVFAREIGGTSFSAGFVDGELAFRQNGTAPADLDAFFQNAAEAGGGDLLATGRLNPNTLEYFGTNANPAIRVAGDLVTVGGGGVGGRYRIAFDDAADAQAFADFANDLLGSDPAPRTLFDQGFDTNGGANRFTMGFNDELASLNSREAGFSFSVSGQAVAGRERFDDLDDLLDRAGELFSGTKSEDGRFNDDQLGENGFANGRQLVDRVGRDGVFESVRLSGQGVAGREFWEFTSGAHAQNFLDFTNALLDAAKSFDDPVT